MNYDLVSDYAPTGDQPHAIEQLTEGVHLPLAKHSLAYSYLYGTLLVV